MPVRPRTLASGSCPSAEQQRVEIPGALSRARILISTSPTSLLTPQEADDLFETLRR